VQEGGRSLVNESLACCWFLLSPIYDGRHMEAGVVFLWIDTIPGPWSLLVYQRRYKRCKQVWALLPDRPDVLRSRIPFVVMHISSCTDGSGSRHVQSRMKDLFLRPLALDNKIFTGLSLSRAQHIPVLNILSVNRCSISL
jgi:hypothetical protein